MGSLERKEGKKMKCQKCNGKMETGFIPDYGFMNEIAQSQWIEGGPEKTWTGIKQKGKKILIIDTFRCISCGSLEFYATGKEGKAR